MAKHTTPPRDAQPIELELELMADDRTATALAKSDEFRPVAYKGERVLTTEMAAQAFEVNSRLLSNNHDRHRDRFEEGKHFYLIVGDELRELKDSTSLRGSVGANARSLILWTDRGIARHAKMLDSDQAWTVYERLEDSYFRAKEAAAQKPTLPDFFDPVAAARAWADEREARILIEKKKAEIGSRREATAMATASAEKRKADALKIKLDQSTVYATAARMTRIHGREFHFAALKKASAALGLEVKKVHDDRWGRVNSYHALAWREAYGVEVPDWTGADRDGEAK